jgi:hypothetical protein
MKIGGFKFMPIKNKIIFGSIHKKKVKERIAKTPHAHRIN